MLSRLFIRHQSQHVIRTRRSRLGDWAWGVAGTLCVVGVLVYAGRVDEKSDARVLQAAKLERQRLKGTPELVRAYEAGMADAVAAINSQPEGLQLAQVCLAMRGGL